MNLPFPADRDMLDEMLERARDAISELQAYGSPGHRRRLGMDRHQGGNTHYPAFARYGLPYALMAIGKDRSILVNRDYKPVGIGIPYGCWVDYEAFPQWHLSGATLARALAAKCWLHVQQGNGFMFDDACPPWASARYLREYQTRLHMLIDALRTEPDLDGPTDAEVAQGYVDAMDALCGTPSNPHRTGRRYTRRVVLGE